MGRYNTINVNKHSSYATITRAFWKSVGYFICKISSQLKLLLNRYKCFIISIPSFKKSYSLYFQYKCDENNDNNTETIYSQKDFISSLSSPWNHLIYPFGCLWEPHTILVRLSPILHFHIVFCIKPTKMGQKTSHYIKPGSI